MMWSRSSHCGPIVAVAAERQRSRTSPRASVSPRRARLYPRLVPPVGGERKGSLRVARAFNLPRERTAPQSHHINAVSQADGRRGQRHRSSLICSSSLHSSKVHPLLRRICPQISRIRLRLGDLPHALAISFKGIYRCSSNEGKAQKSE